MCEKVGRVMAKTGCTSCTKRTISFEVSEFHTETRLLHLFELHCFSVLKINYISLNGAYRTQEKSGVVISLKNEVPV